MRARTFHTHTLAQASVILGLACGGAGDSASSGHADEVVADADLEPGVGGSAEGALGGLTAPAPEGACEMVSDPHASASLALPAGEVEVAGTCASSVASETFTSSLCSCADTNVAGYLRTRSFRSSEGPNAPEVLGGSVGVNGSYITGGFADVGGSFTVAGPRDVVFAGFLQAGEDLRLRPSFSVAGFVDVTRDAWLGGSLRAVARVAVGRDLYRAPGTGVLGLTLLDVGGVERIEDVRVAPPCDCEQLLDVAALVAEARTLNDNTSIGLDPEALARVAGVGTALALPTGRFYLRELGGLGALRLRISGKAALFVEDDFVAGGLFSVALDPGAEIDIFVQGNFVLAGAAILGDPARPRATRIYVGGSGDIAVAGLNAFVGNLYAPTANVLVGGVGRVYGSLFGKNVVAAGFLDVGYDESIREGSPGCPPEDPTPGDDPSVPVTCVPAEVPSPR
jgi:hypothetical protein